LGDTLYFAAAKGYRRASNTTNGRSAGREGTTMHYVMLLRWKQGLTREQRDGALINRAGWKYPSGVEVVAEYWPSAEDPAVVSIFRTDDFGALMEIAFTWGAIFDITTLPAISAEDGLKIGPDVLGRRQF
jgi:hypothetical protein